jgi:hypothetical protein
VAPWAASWWARSPEHTDLWLAAGLAHANWGKNPGPHHVFPLYYRDAASQTFLTPLFGWNKEERGFVYPVTPLAGVYTGQESGSWAFPIYSYARDKQSGDLSERFLLLGGYNETRGHSHSWFIPLFTFRDDGPLESTPKQGSETYGKKFWGFPFCWYQNRCHVSSSKPSATNTPTTTLIGTNAVIVREYSYKNGAFPLWSYNRKSIPAEKKSVVKASTGVILYDYKHEETPWFGGKPGATNDYTRARVLWRLYHYERRNDDVSIDLFPTVTYDSKTDGSRKFSFLWRFCRYERAATGSKKLDLLFVPVLRSK